MFLKEVKKCFENEQMLSRTKRAGRFGNTHSRSKYTIGEVRSSHTSLSSNLRLRIWTGDHGGCNAGHDARSLDQNRRTLISSVYSMNASREQRLPHVLSSCVLGSLPALYTSAEAQYYTAKTMSIHFFSLNFLSLEIPRTWVASMI